MLTDLKCRNARPREQAYKLADANGLYLFVTTTGFRSWRMKYRFAGSERRLTFGGYPEVSIAEARERRDAARRLLRDGIDPAVARKQQAAVLKVAAGNTFEAIARDWHLRNQSLWQPRYAQQVLERLEADIFPVFGAVPIQQVTPPLVLAAIRLIEARGSIEMAHRVRQHVSGVFVFAIATGLASQDPSHVIKSALVPTSQRRQPALLTIAAARQVLVNIEAESHVYRITKLASRLLALTAARPGIVRFAQCEEFEDLDGAQPIWRVPPTKMKLTRERRADVAFEFVLPLSRQAVDVVRAARQLAGGKGNLFPSARAAHKPISNNALGKLYRDHGFQDRHVPHGWRSTFSTVMNERAIELGSAGDRAIIDLMLAHLPDGVEAAYNRAAYMPRRRAIAQEWADLLMAGLPAAEALLRR